jgi:hypothetical protein
MGSLSGTIILCDQVYQAQGGKYILAGTYTTVEVRCRDLATVEHQINGLSMYLRLRPEQLGALTCELLLRNEALAYWDEPLMRTSWEMRVTEHNFRMLEMMMVSPAFLIRPGFPAEVAATGEGLLKYSIEFRVNGEVIGTTPLDVRFVTQGTKSQ